MERSDIEPIICSRIIESAHIYADLARIIAEYAYQSTCDYLRDLFCSNHGEILLDYKSKWTLHLCDAGETISVTFYRISPSGNLTFLFSCSPTYSSLVYFAFYSDRSSGLFINIQCDSSKTIAEYFGSSIKQMIYARVFGSKKDATATKSGKK